MDIRVFMSLSNTYMINVQIGDTNYEALKAELSKYTSVENMAMASHIPAAGTTYGESIRVNPLDLYFILISQTASGYVYQLKSSIPFNGWEWDRNSASWIECEPDHTLWQQ